MSITPEGSVGVPESRDDPRGIIFNIQRYSIQDGPGIRTTVFLKGCPLRCEWCSNPESQILQPQILRDLEKCAHCGLCTDEPQKDISLCPASALSMDSEIMDVSTVVQKV